MTTLEALLVEAETFQRRLTAEANISALEQRLYAAMVPLKLDSPEPFVDVCANSGIYYMEARFPFKRYEDLDDFGTRWGKAKAQNVPKGSSRYYVGRAKKQKKRIATGEFVPFYLGKETNVQNRLTGHLTGAEDATTYSLKLKTRAQLLSNVEFRFGFVEIPVHEDAYFCLGLLEKALRDRLNPIIGRQ